MLLENENDTFRNDMQLFEDAFIHGSKSKENIDASVGITDIKKIINDLKSMSDFL